MTGETNSDPHPFTSLKWVGHSVGLTGDRWHHAMSLPAVRPGRGQAGERRKPGGHGIHCGSEVFITFSHRTLQSRPRAETHTPGCAAWFLCGAVARHAWDRGHLSRLRERQTDNIFRSARLLVCLATISWGGASRTSNGSNAAVWLESLHSGAAMSSLCTAASLSPPANRAAGWQPPAILIETWLDHAPGWLCIDKHRRAFLAGRPLLHGSCSNQDALPAGPDRIFPANFPLH